MILLDKISRHGFFSDRYGSEVIVARCGWFAVKVLIFQIGARCRGPESLLGDIESRKESEARRLRRRPKSFCHNPTNAPGTSVKGQKFSESTVKKSSTGYD